MALTDRNRLEQEALLAMEKGNTEGALNAWLQILKMDPKDRRLRQKVGELYLKVNRPLEAQKHLREVADGLMKEGNHRAAVAVLKQLVNVVGDDPQLQLDLAESYLAAGYPNDARPCFDQAMRLFVNFSKPALAAKAARRLAELSPGEPAMKLKVAELLEAANDVPGTLEVYQEVMGEYRRRGRPDEVGRVAELALKLKPEDLGLTLDAAAARVEGQDWKKALAHLQPAFAVAPRDPRVLDLLAKAFEGAGQPDRALKVLNELARVAGERGDIPLETSALRRASKLGLDDPELKNRLEQAEARLARLERRLSSLALYQPADEKVLRCQARSEVLHRYGFTERAVACIQEGLAAESDSIPLLATLAEIHVDMDKKEEAIAFMFQIHARAGSEADAVADRIDILGGSAPIEAVKPTQPAVSDDEVVVDDEEEEVIEEIIDDEDAPTGEVAIPAELKGDRLADAGDLQGALLSWREALGADPSNERILQKIASLRSRARATPPPEPPKTVEKPAPPKPVEPVKPPPVDDDIFARMLAEDPVIEEIDPEELDESPQLESKPTAEPEKDERVLEARSLVAVGLNQEGLVMLQGVAGLAARVIEAQALKNLAQLSRAVDVLREASNEAAEADPAYPEALFELAGLYIVTAKYKAALRLIEELMDVAPDYRTQDVVARNRGLNRLMKG